MSLYDDLRADVKGVFKEAWSERDGNKVPEPEDVKLGNDAVRLDATVLYTDLSESTNLVDRYKPWFAAEIYKTFLHCAAKIIRSHGGVLTSYDGDRVMAVYIGDSKNSSAGRAALGINYAVREVINAEIEKAYPKESYRVQHTTGIDSSRLFVARTGIRGSNDLVWVGRAANHAAKLSASDFGVPTVVTEDVYKRLNESVKYSSDGKSMWVKGYWEDEGRAVYSSTWQWAV